MMNTDYKTECLSFLLDRSCLAEKYYPLIEYKETLVTYFTSLGCIRKSDIQKLPDDEFSRSGLDGTLIRLFRRFLSLYDPSDRKFREIEKLSRDSEMITSFKELYHLPGVKYVRANLYYLSGFKTLEVIASSTVENILKKTADTIAERNLDCIVPLPKEVRTHIAVAKAFTE